MRFGLAVFIGACLISTTPAVAKSPPAVSPLALQQMQARDYEVSKAITFPSVMTVLQDSGYRIESADKDTGLITGTASTTSKTTYNLFWGLGKKKKTPVVSAFVEDRGNGSRIRLNFVLTTTKSRVYGVNSADEEPIADPAIYRDAFERIEKEIFVRQAMNAPTPTPQVTPAVATVPPAVATSPANPAQTQGPSPALQVPVPSAASVAQSAAPLQDPPSEIQSLPATQQPKKVGGQQSRSKSDRCQRAPFAPSCE